MEGVTTKGWGKSIKTFRNTLGIDSFGMGAGTKPTAKPTTQPTAQSIAQSIAQPTAKPTTQTTA